MFRVALPVLAALVLVLALAPMLKAAASMAAVGSAGAAATHEDHRHQGDAPAHGHGITLGQLAAEQRAARLRKVSLPSATAPMRASAAGSWQAQFGAFSASEAAERQRAKIAQSGAAAAADLIVEPAGALYRLASLARETREEVAQLCARANASGLDCFVRRVAEAG